MKNETPNHYLRNGKAFHDEMLEKYGPEKVAIFFMINAEKYRSRAGKKDSSPKKIVEDIEKALHCEDLQAHFSAMSLIENTDSEAFNVKVKAEDGVQKCYKPTSDALPRIEAIHGVTLDQFSKEVNELLEVLGQPRQYPHEFGNFWANGSTAKEYVESWMYRDKNVSEITSEGQQFNIYRSNLENRLWPFNQYKALVTVIIDQTSCFKDKDKYPHDSWLEKMQATNVSAETAVIHWFADLLSGKVKRDNYSEKVCSYAQQEMNKAISPAQESKSSTVNEWTLPAYANEVNKFLEMLGYEPLSPHKVSHACADGQSPRMFVEQTLGTMINGKTSVYEVSQQIEKALNEEKSKQFYFERVAAKVRESGTGPFGVGRGFTDKCMQAGQSAEECAQAWTKRN